MEHSKAIVAELKRVALIRIEEAAIAGHLQLQADRLLGEWNGLDQETSTLISQARASMAKSKPLMAARHYWLR